MSQSFNIFNIRNMTHQPNNLKIQAFVYICNEIKKIIKSRASQGFYEVNYQIPAFILGYPPYNIIDCASYQYNEFIREHFEVNIRKSGDFLYLNISWKKPPPVPEPVNHLYARKYKNSIRSDAGSTSAVRQNTYRAIDNSLNPLVTTASVGRKKKKSKDNDATKTMNFFHSSGFVDTLPVNTSKTSMYL